MTSTAPITGNALLRADRPTRHAQVNSISTGCVRDYRRPTIGRASGAFL